MVLTKTERLYKAVMDEYSRSMPKMVKKALIEFREDLAMANDTVNKLYKERRENRRQINELRVQIKKLKQKAIDNAGHAADNADPPTGHAADPNGLPNEKTVGYKYEIHGPKKDFDEKFEGDSGHVQFLPQERSYRQLRNENATLNWAGSKYGPLYPPRGGPVAPVAPSDVIP